MQAVVDCCCDGCQKHERTAAVLVPRNRRGFEIVDALRKTAQVEYVELLQSTTSTREAAGALGNVLQYLAQPDSSRLLGTIYKVWRRDEREDEATAMRLDNIVRLIRNCPRLEDYLYPQLGRDWLRDDPEIAAMIETDAELRAQLIAFGLVRRWQETVLLPIDQLILIVAQDLFHSGRPCHRLQHRRGTQAVRRATPGMALAGIHRRTCRNRPQ